MAIEVFDNNDYRGDESLILTLDKSKRIYLSKPVQRFFGVEDKKKHLKCYLGYDSVNHRIAIAKTDVVKIPGKRPVVFGDFKFVSARRFIERFKIDISKAPIHYQYVGQEGDWYCFQEVGYQAPDLEDIN